ncbi:MULTISPECIES: cation:proton antiporter [Roseobacteraceae]|uniref:K(+)/H(+) antiporter NhaP n=1 Tax=Pseudosulfitobacter pseudonitzschiae TaxID=1402135 RepID=A0A221K705_9RHOB|nr:MULTISPECIES: sodium:proton antiporter [Roseobacteraceae]ASM74650.1 K(+)/H(+) antiporter NhaP [Pseudosulfitobacter pseudonitzschiae]
MQITPIEAIALVGILGVGAQWLAWRLRLPSIVLMLLAGLLVGPAFGWFIPERDLGEIYKPLISIAVALILFEGGLTLEFHRLGEGRNAVRRLVYIGAPLGWLLATLAMLLTMGLPWQVAAVFGGVLVVTGPTVIAPMLRQAKLRRSPAQLLQWEAIINDPIGVLIAVLALEIVLVVQGGLSTGEAVWVLATGIGFAAAVGVLAGLGVARLFQRGLAPEYMKVPLLFVMVIAVFAMTDALLHESGLLAVTLMGMVMANAKLASHSELHRFKENAALLLVSGVFILMAASLNFASLATLNWKAALFVVAVILVVRPAQVLLPLLGSSTPWRERILVASTGPRGVVMVAVSGLFGDKLVEAGIPEGTLLAPLAFVLVLTTVILHGFTLAPVARALGLSGGDKPGVLILGGSAFGIALAQALQKIEVTPLIVDPNFRNITAARQQSIAAFHGDILGEAAEHHVELIGYDVLLAASDNDAYNTLVATDLGQELGRTNVWQVQRAKENMSRHALPPQLGGQAINGELSHGEFQRRMAGGWRVRVTHLTEKYDLDTWRQDNPKALILMQRTARGDVTFLGPEQELDRTRDCTVLALTPPAETNESADTLRSQSDI